jgi:hypothetical protein
VSKPPKSASTRALTASTCSRVTMPRAIPDWFETTPTGTPAARTACTASSAPGMGRTSAGSPL